MGLLDAVILTLSTGAVLLSLVALAKRPPAERKQVGELRVMVHELVDELEKLHALLAKKNQRQVMRERREDPDVIHDNAWKQRKNETAAEWKARTRELLSKGAKPN
jgi:hypothetical protein